LNGWPPLQPPERLLVPRLWLLLLLQLQQQLLHLQVTKSGSGIMPQLVASKLPERHLVQ